MSPSSTTQSPTARSTSHIQAPANVAPEIYLPTSTYRFAPYLIEGLLQPDRAISILTHVESVPEQIRRLPTETPTTRPPLY